jgi:glycosyltransferase involved in cell wall biosynthesis
MVGETGENLVFLMGLPRSGTTLLSVMLDRHPQLRCPPEPWVMLALQAIGKAPFRHPADAPVLWQAFRQFCEGDAAIPAARSFARTLYNQKLESAQKQIFIDKTPRYYLIIPYLQQVFPNARYIVLMRNPLDVAASNKTTWGFDLPQLLSTRQDHPAAIDLIIGLRRLRDLARSNTAGIHAVKYEDLVRDPSAQLSELLKSLGLPDAPGLSNFDLSGDRHATSIVGDKKIVGTHAPHQGSVSGWEKVFNRDEVQVLLDSVGTQIMTDLGYADAVARAAAMGFTDRGPQLAAEHISRLEEALQARDSGFNADTYADVVMLEQRLRGLLSESETSNDPRPSSDPRRDLQESVAGAQRLHDAARRDRESAAVVQSKLDQVRRELVPTIRHAQTLLVHTAVAREAFEALTHKTRVLHARLKAYLSSKLVRAAWFVGILPWPQWADAFLSRPVDAPDMQWDSSGANELRQSIGRLRVAAEIDEAAELAPPASWAGARNLFPPLNELPGFNPAALSLSVITCTHNPRRDILDRTLDALEHQTLPKSSWELVIVDNGSSPPLDAQELRRNRSLRLRVISEPQVGTAFSRCAGIVDSRADLLVMVDDDNLLDADYLEVAIRIALSLPRLGAFGGICRPVFQTPAPVWTRKLLPYLAIRDYGPEPITSEEDCWGHWEPVGAGMVVRREVAEKFVEMVRRIPEARQLSRTGKSLLGGEDSLLARAAYRCGYACSYQPALKLSHYMKSSRLRGRYLMRLMEGNGRSHVILQRTLGQRVAPISPPALLSRLAYRIRRDGIAGAVGWAWDVGYWSQMRKGPASQTTSPMMRQVERDRSIAKKEDPPATMQARPEFTNGTPALSVIICAHNPRSAVLAKVLCSLERQTLAKQSWELVIVDNNSSPPLDATSLDAGGLLALRVIREERIGLNFARCRGIAEARAPLLMLVDDDTVLDHDYLENAIRIARSEPGIGAFGGICRPGFQLPTSRWQKKLLVFLAVRDYGPQPLTSRKDCWGEWEPIGAGMVFRREVGQKFVEMVNSVPEAQRLDRSGKSLLSGGDSLLARAAYRVGYACSYQPSLKLSHHLKKSRLGARYLLRLMEGHGRSYVLLQRALGQPVEPLALSELFDRLSYRIGKDGLAGAIHWAWDWGYWAEARFSKEP